MRTGEETAADKGWQHIFGRWEAEAGVVSHTAARGRLKA